MTSNFVADASIASALERGILSPPAGTSTRRLRGREGAYLPSHLAIRGTYGQVSSAGDFITTHLGDLPVVIVRDTGGALRAFANVCRHRGSEVVLECAGNRKTLQCHYHGWTYNLDGTLRTAPRENEQRSFAKETLSLAFAVETWGPLIFVNPSPALDTLRDVIGELPVVFERAGIKLAQMRMLRRDHLRSRVELESRRRKFQRMLSLPDRASEIFVGVDTDSYRVDTDHEFYSTYYGPILRIAGHSVTYATLWPNVMFALSGNPPSMQVICAVPSDVGHLVQTVDYFFAGDPTEAQMRDYVEFSDLVTREDIVLCESVQRGLCSGAIKHGRLMLSRERGIQHFQKLVYRFLSAE